MKIIFKILFLILGPHLLSACGEDSEGDEQKSRAPLPIAAEFRNCNLKSVARSTVKDFGSDIGTPSLLSVVAWAEGLGDCYYYTFAYKTFDSFVDHPRMKVCASGLCSTAAGRYQFLAATWEQLALKYRYPTFEPVYQDEGAWALMKEKQVNDTAAIYDFPRFKRAMGILGQVWASLPGSPYGQPTRSIEEAWQRYQANVSKP